MKKFKMEKVEMEAVRRTPESEFEDSFVSKLLSDISARGCRFRNQDEIQLDARQVEYVLG